MQGKAFDKPRPLICVVDDDADTRELYRLVLESAGYRVEDAAHADGARALFRRSDPNVVMTDWLLPDGNALDVCVALRARMGTRHVPVVAVTGLTLDHQTEGAAREHGCVAVVEKPADPDAILQAARAALTLDTGRRVRAAAERAKRYAARVQRQAAQTGAAAARIDSTLLDQAAARSGHAISVLLADDCARYVAAGGATRDLTGYESHEIAALSIWDLTPDPNRPGSEGLWQQFLASGHHGGSYELRRRDGRTVVAQYYAIPNVAPGLHVSALAEVSQIPASLGAM